MWESVHANSLLASRHAHANLLPPNCSVCHAAINSPLTDALLFLGKIFSPAKLFFPPGGMENILAVLMQGRDAYRPILSSRHERVVYSLTEHVQFEEFGRQR